MTRYLIAAIVALVLIAAIATFSRANAADTYARQSSVKDTSAPIMLDAPATVNWSGVYIGGGVGYGNANHDLTVQQYNGAYCYDAFGDLATPGDDFNPRNPGNQEENIFGDFRVVNLPAQGECADVLTNGGAGQYVPVAASSETVGRLDGANSHGIVGDIRLGGDIQRDAFVFGVFGSYGFNAMETSGNVGGLRLDIEKGDEWSVGARAGVVFGNRTLLYILAAYTATEYDFTLRDGDARLSKNTDFDGLTVGGGIEYAVSQNFFLGLEYQHTFYGEEKVLDTGAEEIGGFGTRVLDDLDEDKVMLTAKFKIGAPGTGLFD